MDVCFVGAINGKGVKSGINFFIRQKKTKKNTDFFNFVVGLRKN
jgi:hypothetical protein